MEGAGNPLHSQLVDGEEIACASTLNSPPAQNVQGVTDSPCDRSSSLAVTSLEVAGRMPLKAATSRYPIPSARLAMPMPVSPSVSLQNPEKSQNSPKMRFEMRIQRGVMVLESNASPLLADQLDAAAVGVLNEGQSIRELRAPITSSALWQGSTIAFGLRFSDDFISDP